MKHRLDHFMRMSFLDQMLTAFCCGLTVGASIIALVLLAAGVR